MTGAATYHIITQTNDYKLAHAFMEQEGLPKQQLSFPTILAIGEDGNILGMLGTRIQSGMIVAGPLVLEGSRRRPRTALRLIDAYDYAMREMGITTYIYDVEETNTNYLRLVKRVYGHEPYATKDGTHFFIKRLTEPGHERL